LFFELSRQNTTEARNDYYDLVTLYSDELRLTTAWMDKRSGPIRRVLESEMDRSARLSVITFNHDLLVENALSLINPTRYGAVWCLRHAYGFDELETCANPSDTFTYMCSGRRSEHVDVFKLHGSLNWVFKTRDAYPPSQPRTRQLMLWNNRVIPAYSRRLSVNRGRDWYLWSLIIPPIYEKQGFIRNELEIVWNEAALALRDADRVLFWGYSFPAADRHARYFFQAAAHENDALRSPILINPDPAAHSALWDVIKPRGVQHYRYVEDYLSDTLSNAETAGSVDDDRALRLIA
jgi:hypothetical protein